MPSRSIGPGVGGLNYSVLLRKPVARADRKPRVAPAAAAVARAASERIKALGPVVVRFAHSFVETVQRMQMAAAEREIARVRRLMDLDASRSRIARYY
jgi:hypothetical protein